MEKEINKILADAQSGNAESQYLIGLHYENEGNINEAFLWYERAATQGYVYGINAVAMYHLKGMAVEPDVYKAIALWENIAEELPTAKVNLGQIYLEGQGCPQDIRKGIELLRQAADSGEGLSALTMGHIYLKGLYGIPVIYKEAVKWFERAYELGIDDSVEFLCDLYGGIHSRSVRDKVKYRYWSNIRKGLEKSRFANESDTLVLEESDGRQYVLIDGKKVYVDILVAETFIINPDPSVYTEVEHIDGDMSNNAASNLRWVKRSKTIEINSYPL
ncbi:hypothetical protein [Phocaeicola plebeius]|uniref:hypothetical protein n=1 Tax=Phocaeicola plebeius TaxID=310297 RepID=UPI00294321BC|nr:hypothetical protein [Phocaeicola plebeius]